MGTHHSRRAGRWAKGALATTLANGSDPVGVILVRDGVRGAARSDRQGRGPAPVIETRATGGTGGVNGPHLGAR